MMVKKIERKVEMIHETKEEKNKIKLKHFAMSK